MTITTPNTVHTSTNHLTQCMIPPKRITEMPTPGRIIRGKQMAWEPCKVFRKSRNSQHFYAIFLIGKQSFQRSPQWSRTRL